MDASDDLRAALQALQDRKDSAASAQAELDRQLEEFEREETVVREHLYEVADLAIKALVDTATQTAESFPVIPEQTRLGRFRSPLNVVGWKVKLGIGKDYVLLPDGGLLESGYPHRPSSHNSTLHKWIDFQLRQVSIESGETSGRILGRDELRHRLSNTKDAITRTLADVLHDREISI